MAIDRSLFSRVSVVHNSKGGVLKTSLTANLGARLAACDEKYRVGLLDLDPQSEKGDLASELGVASASDSGAYLTQCLREGIPLNPEEFLEISPGLELLSGGEELNDLVWQGYSREQCIDLLAAIIHPIIDVYDFILIDTPPGIQHMIYMAMGAAHNVLVPTAKDIGSIKSSERARRHIRFVQQYNPYLHEFGVVLVNVPNGATQLNAKARSQINKSWGTDPDLLFSTTYRTADKVSVYARENGLSVSEVMDLAKNDPYAGLSPFLREKKARSDAEARGEEFDASTLRNLPDEKSLKGLHEDLVRIGDEFVNRMIAQEAAYEIEGEAN